MSRSHLMGELMADYHSNPKFIRNGGCEGIKEKAGLSVGGQTPVLHRTRLEVRDGYQIWERENTGQRTEGERGKKKKEMPCGLVTEKVNKAHLVWVEDSGCWNTPHRSLAFWQQPPGHSGFAATSQGRHRRTPTDTQQCMKNTKKCVTEKTIMLARNGRNSNIVREATPAPQKMLSQWQIWSHRRQKLRGTCSSLHLHQSGPQAGRRLLWLFSPERHKQSIVGVFHTHLNMCDNWEICNTHYRHVGQRNVLWTPPDPYGEVCFEAWLIETRECHPSTCGLKVSWS